MINLRDETEFKIHQKQMEEADNFNKMENDQRRKIQLELAREAAIEAFKEKIEEKNGIVKNMKKLADDFKHER